MGGAHATNGVNVGIAHNRFNAPNKAVVFAYGYFSLPPAVYITQSDFTVTVWVKITKTTSGASLFDFANGIALDNILLLVTNVAQKKPEMIIVSGTTQYRAQSDSALAVDTWCHFAFVFERDTMYL